MNVPGTRSLNALRELVAQKEKNKPFLVDSAELRSAFAITPVNGVSLALVKMKGYVSRVKWKPKIVISVDNAQEHVATIVHGRSGDPVRAQEYAILEKLKMKPAAQAVQQESAASEIITEPAVGPANGVHGPIVRVPPTQFPRFVEMELTKTAMGQMKKILTNTNPITIVIHAPF